MNLKSGIVILAAIAAIILGVSVLSAYEAIVGPTGVLLYDKDKSYEGYTLFSPMGNKTTYLIDMEGYVIHTWEAEYTPGAYAALLENGNLLRAGSLRGSPATFGGVGGILQEIDWDGNVVWEYKLLNDNEVQHHCFARIPNGNTLILAWERISVEDFIAKGRDLKKIPVRGPGFNGKFQNDFWVDFVREVNPAGETVWEWHVWDHVGTGPYQFDINYTVVDPMGSEFDWTHFNTVEYIEENDQVLLNSRNFSEFYIIDHKSGKMVYRWGNPSAYGQGEPPSWMNNGDQKVFGSHNATYLGRNRFLLFDNGSERPEGNRSAAVEVDARTGNIEWQYTASSSNSLYSARQGGAQRLSNGNTLITSANSGHLIEVTQDKQVVWDFVNPVAGQNEASCYLGGGGRAANMIHRAYRYAGDYPGLQGKNLSRKRHLAEGCPEFYKVYKTEPKPAPKKKALR
jgi:hypothetical protein